MPRTNVVGKHRHLAVVITLVAVFGSTIRNRANLALIQPGGHSFVTMTTTGPAEPTNITQSMSHPTYSSFLLSKTSSEFRPTTKVDRDECDPMPSQPLRKVTSFPQYQNPSTFWNRTGYEDDVAVCELSLQPRSTAHFPHVMQQLYACFSYWQGYPTRQPILLTTMPSKVARSKLSRNPFLDGFLHAMETQGGLQLMSRDELNLWVDEKKETQKDGNHGGTGRYSVQSFQIPGGFVLSNPQNLTDLVRADLQLASPEVKSPTNDTLGVSKEVQPRIGVLNRKSNSGRSIANVDQLVKSISEMMANMSVSIAPVVVYFEGKSFRDQVEFFNGVDILISPHGAQLTGLPFMAGKRCSHLLELFPRGYSIPTFFGSLAVNAQVRYSYLYLSDQPPDHAEEQARDRRERIAARSIQLCPPSALIAECVLTLVQDWCHCRAQIAMEPAE
jgi:Glycosyltransferase 61